MRRREQAEAAEYQPALPQFTTAAVYTEPVEAVGVSPLSRALQLATAHRLRGETVAAAEQYDTVLAFSRKPTPLRLLLCGGGPRQWR